jgi:hypothetical protein
MILSKKEIAESFSNGKFDMTFPYLAEDVCWNIIGDKEVSGKMEVVSICEKSQTNKELAQTIFTTDQIIKDKNKVVVKGSGEFIRHGERINLIAACDVYEFNEKDELSVISSYCIAEK